MADKLRPFVGVDGEGCGRNRHGQQHYKLLGAGNAEPLYTGKHLSPVECCNWLCDLPWGPIYVGFSFGYDASQILRDLPAERLSNAEWADDGTLIKPGTGIFDDKATGVGRSRYTWFQPDDKLAGAGFGIEYLPKNYLRVCRLRRKRFLVAGKYETHVSTVPDSSRTIWETFGFFQMSFLNALQAFDIGREHWELIERNKANRADFARITREIRRYNQLECELLAQLMERFRETCHANDLRPKTWNGAGKLAAAEHDKHGTLTAERLAELAPSGVLQLASDAYYGGRFEVTRIGEVPGPIFEYDINSAYPTAMLSLPCLLHGTWEPFTGNPPPKSLHVAYVTFSHKPDAAICGLPIRQKDGRLYWPRQGQGIYWSVELNAARRLGTVLRYTAGWRYVCNCECRPFDWIEPRYEQRRALGKNAAGYPIKLALNSLYGKLAQRIGNPRWANLVWAGLITATTRARLNDAARQAPHDIVMFATDGMFAKSRLSLPCGERLGQWEASEHDRLFVCQPGVYWGAKRPKTRGVPISELAKHTEKFEKDWRLWCHTFRDLTGPPIVTIPLPLFVGLRLAHARGKPETAGVWTRGDTAKRGFSFDWSRKRSAKPIWETPTCVNTLPADGAPDLVSMPHSSNTAWSRLNHERMEFEDQPDAVDLSPVL